MQVIREKMVFLRWQKASAEADVKDLRAQLHMARNEITSLRNRQDASSHEIATYGLLN